MSDRAKVTIFAVLAIWSATNLGTLLYCFSSPQMKAPPAPLALLASLWFLASLIAVPAWFLDMWIREVKKAAEHPLAKEIE